MKGSTWKDPNLSLLTIRCMEKQYADTFISRGCLKFNTPKFWEEWAEKGRGDVYEGALAFYSRQYPTQYEGLKYKYPNAYQYELEKRILLKDKRDMNLPCLCFYTSTLKNYAVPSEEGKKKISTIIDGRYFKDFADNKTVEEIARLPLEEQPAMVLIQDFDEFLKRLKSALIDHGLKEDEILVQLVEYIDHSTFGGDDSWMDFNTKSPKELFVKSKDFSYQNELRIVIDTDDPVQLKLFENPIDIGNLSDIAVESVGYHPEGVILGATANIQMTD